MQGALRRDDTCYGHFLGSYAFYGCTGLKSIELPDKLKVVQGSVFEGCSALSAISIPKSVVSIGYTAFTCDNLTAIQVDAENAAFSSKDGVLFNKTQTILICYPSGKTAASYTIPDSVTTVGDWSFFGATYLTHVTIGNSVTALRDAAFSGCSSLTNSALSGQLTTIRDLVFSECTALTSLTLPSGIAYIGSAAFRGCTNLTDVTFADQTDWTADGQPIDVSDAEQNALYLTDGYLECIWEKK